MSVDRAEPDTFGGSSVNDDKRSLGSALSLKCYSVMHRMDLERNTRVVDLQGIINAFVRSADLITENAVICRKPLDKENFWICEWVALKELFHNSMKSC